MSWQTQSNSMVGAGMVGALCNNNMGVCGVAPNVRCCPLRPHASKGKSIAC